VKDETVLKVMAWVLFVVVGLALLVGMSGCTDADVASRNISKAADMFEVKRHIVFYNGITGEYMLEMVGNCSIYADTRDGQVEITCKVGPEEYVKNYLGLSDNVTYFAEQIQGANVSVYHYRVIWKPLALIPDIDLR
jgi:hypothetical protein